MYTVTYVKRGRHSSFQLEFTVENPGNKTALLTRGFFMIACFLPVNSLSHILHILEKITESQK